jgi:hypothetical protein
MKKILSAMLVAFAIAGSAYFVAGQAGAKAVTAAACTTQCE